MAQILKKFCYVDSIPFRRERVGSHVVQPARRHPVDRRPLVGLPARFLHEPGSAGTLAPVGQLDQPDARRMRHRDRRRRQVLDFSDWTLSAAPQTLPDNQRGRFFL